MTERVRTVAVLGGGSIKFATDSDITDRGLLPCPYCVYYVPEALLTSHVAEAHHVKPRNQGPYR